MARKLVVKAIRIYCIEILQTMYKLHCKINIAYWSLHNVPTAVYQISFLVALQLLREYCVWSGGNRAWPYVIAERVVEQY